MFSAPIPGQSLTTPPKNFPWERPPELTDPEEVMQMHITRLSDPEMLDAALNLMELEGLDIATLTKGILRGAISQGLHSIDVGLVVAPVIHEFLKQAAVAAGIPAEDGFEDKGKKAAENQTVIAARARKQLEAMGAKPKEVIQEEVPVEPEEAPVVRRGLMAREGV